MSETFRPYLAAGVALAGAGMLAVTPLAPVPDVQQAAARGIDVTLTALTDPLTPYLDLFADSFGNIASIGAGRLADPAPLLTTVLGNQFGYAENVVNSLTGVTGGLFNAFLDLPDQLAPVFTDLFAGNITGASTGLIDAINQTLLKPIVLELALGDLGKVLAIPATMTQNLADGVAAAMGPLLMAGLGILAPVYGVITAAGDSGQGIVDALTAMDPLAAFGTALGAPGEIANAFLNGVVAEGLPGLLSAPGGLVDTLVNALPQAVAGGIGSNPAAFAGLGAGLFAADMPDFAGMLTSAFDGLDLGNLGGLLDGFGALPDLFTQLPTMLLGMLLGL